MASYRYRTSAIVGPWRPTRQEALRDALNAGQCRRDDASPEGQSWAVPGKIETDGGGRPRQAGHQFAGMPFANR